ncbi:MAG TPA: ABC transporter substrate-binding protein [Solirubrobacterales bacterium]|nr:ABC transporter substrate-binding protein [Solirubrobacterales bacterium]
MKGLVALTAAVLALGAAGCGGGEEHEGGTLRGASLSFPDYLDPGLSYTLEGWTSMYNTYVPLLTYAHASGSEGTKLIPGLAKSLPEISDDGRTYSLTLRSGLEYSDGTPVRASDFRATIERLFRLDSPGSAMYTVIAGAERFSTTKRGGIGGIQAADRSGRIVIRLVEPSSSFSNLLATLFAAPVPPGTPASNQTRNPPPATGPYEITSSEPDQSWEYRRNPAWARSNSAAMPDLPDGHVGRIRMAVVGNASAEVSEIERGRLDWMQNPPPPDRYAEIRKRFEGTQFRPEPVISNFYFWMNTRRAPFDDVRVRRAVNYALEPGALERIYAGSLTRFQQIIPPGMPGFRRFQPYPHDLGKAKALVAAADPSDRRVTVWTDSIPPAKEAGEYYEQVLDRIGLEAKLKAVPPATYFTVIGNPSTPDLDTGWSNWLLEYPNPNSLFGPQLSGKGITGINDTNYARFDDPAIDAEISHLGREQLGPKQEGEYAALDRKVMAEAPWAPFGNLTLATFVSNEIDLDRVVYNPIYGHDLTSFEFR